MSYDTVIYVVFFFYNQPVTEKHKINVPETMNEFLDMSDDEGEANLLYYLQYCTHTHTHNLSFCLWTGL